MSSPRWSLPWILMGSVCAACSLQPTKQPRQAVPTTFETVSPGDSASWPSKEWYRSFASGELDSLIDEAAANNFDVARARARVAQADARAKQAHAGILPSVDAGGNANYLAGHSNNGSAHETDWAALLSASYEVDFWGKNQATANSARYLSVAARAERETVAITTLAGVADGYFQLLSLRERLKGCAVECQSRSRTHGHRRCTLQGRIVGPRGSGHTKSCIGNGGKDRSGT